ncbi:MAG TPA: hypothetical protein PKD64_13995 [Pirellulaceae bacterium]|nr:hypothetical protein [Pirellulaceae bacterium]HMO93299.1 hypothetical protein [Pirellulaceae bacterium]HMP70161.1 hypothetical protein [Pirellulaceae bacterium]
MNQFPFTLEQENAAREFLKSWNNPRAHGIKCWYCDANNIEKGSETLFIGLNPGGNDDSKKLDERAGYLESPYSVPGFNSWIDEEWPDRGPSHQAAVQRVFQTLYSDGWENKLRTSACTNIFPVRTETTDAIDKSGWLFAERWFGNILKHVRPKFVICNGNNQTNSAWAYLVKHYNCAMISEIDIGANAFVKKGTFELNGERCSVLGLPNLPRFMRPRLIDAIQQLVKCKVI